MRETREWSAARQMDAGRPYEARHRAPARGRTLRLHPAAARVAAAPVPLIDRERELGAVRGALSDALAGHGRVVLIGGEPGIGKTRLARAVADDAAARGMAVWWGRGWEDGSAPAFWPWNTALRRWRDQVGRDVVAAAVDGWGGELANVFPALRDEATPLATCCGDASTRWETDGARFRLFDIVSRFLAAVARPAGLLVVLDDVHWADRSSLKLLEFVAATLGDARLLLVATYRDTEVGPDDACGATLAAVARESATLRLQLHGLSAESCTRWLELTGARGDLAAQGAALHRETNGNPFFVGELVQLRTGGMRAAAADAPAVPQGVRAVIARRLDRLGAPCRAALAVAALLGDPIETAMLTDVLGDAHDGALPDHLARAARDRILVASDGRSGEWSFAHALIRRVLVDELSPSARTAWHARIAAVLERRTATSELATTEIVRHLAAAGTPESLHRAFEHAVRGAERAAHGLGWEEAVRLYEIALDVGRRSGQLDARRATALRLGLARALRGSGDVPAARACCEEVMTACRRTPDPNTFARAALIHAGPMPEWGRLDPAVRAVLEEACRLGDAVDDALRVRLYARLAGDLVAANEIAQGPRIFALCDDAAAAARRAGEDGALAIALMGTYFAAVMGMSTGDRQIEIPSTQVILEAAEAGGEHEYAAAIRYARCITLLAINEADAFSAEIDALAATSAAAHVPEGLWLTEALVALRHTVQGRFADAERAIERARAIGSRMHVPNAAGVHAAQRIMWHAFQGRLGEAADEVEEFVATHPTGSGWRPMRALARLARGDVVAARAELQDLMAAGSPRDRGTMARFQLAGLAALCIGLRDRTHAPALYARLARRPETWSADGCQTLGPWELLRGGLARLCDHPDDAARHFEATIQLGRRGQSPPIVARAQSQLVSLRLAMQPDAAERERLGAMLAEAAQTAAALGLRDVGARVARLQAKLAAAPAPTDARNAFACEGDVWTVQYGGRTLRLKDGKGPRYLAALLAAPRREFHVLEFVPAAPARAVSAAAEGLAVRVTDADATAVPDAQARRAYRARLAELRAELDEAEGFADAGRAERLREELDRLTDELATRFGGKTPRQGQAETARKAVTKVLRTQIARLLDAHPELGRHLRDTVRLGTVCVYAPTTPIDWDVAFAPA
jgi:hypothetical protein